jgi:hypothetical protein
MKQPLMTGCCAWAWPFRRSILNGLNFCLPVRSEAKAGLHLLFHTKGGKQFSDFTSRAKENHLKTGMAACQTTENKNHLSYT